MTDYDPTDTPALELQHVRIVHRAGRPDEVVALRGIDLAVPAGQLVTVVGSNGAGKSSMIQVVSGAVRPASGRVRIGGRDVTRRPDWRRAGDVARVFDDPRKGTAPELSVEDNLALALRRGGRRRLWPAVTPRRRVLMREQLARLGLGLEDRLHEEVGSLSAGQRQSITMIMAALGAPRVLLLDEHLAALDPATARRVLDLTAELARDLGSATVMVTHNMEHALELGDRLLVMGGGRVVADLPRARTRAMAPADVVEVLVSSGESASDRSLLAATEAGES